MAAMPRVTLFIICTLSCSWFSAGCSSEPRVPSGKVTGTVKLDGKPVSDAVVTFSEQKTSINAFGDTDSNGAFALSYGGGRAIPVGKFKVRVAPKETPAPPAAAGGAATPQKEEPSPIPKKYRNFETSELTADVKDGVNELNFDLKN